MNNEDNKYKRLVRSIQDEFAKQFIHQGLEIQDVVERINSTPASSICYQTVQRFVQMGRGGKKFKGYSRGPYATTVFAIADALGFQMVARERTEAPRPKAGQSLRSNM